MAVHGPDWATTAQHPVDCPWNPSMHWRESEDIEGLLFCGTDGGVYASIDGGFAWFLAHPDLPRTPVHDLAIQERENALVIGTHGRSIWILDPQPLHRRALRGGEQHPRNAAAGHVVAGSTHLARILGRARLRLGRPPHSPKPTCRCSFQKDGDYVLEISDSTDAVVAQTPLDGKRRGWQTLKFTPETAQEGEFLSLGNYTLSLMKAGDNKNGVSVDWAIVEEED